MTPLPSPSPGATPTVLRALRVVLHVSFAGLLALALLRTLLTDPSGAWWPLAVSLLLAGTYLAGTVQEHRQLRGLRGAVRPLASALWLTAVLALWVLLVLHAPDFSWVVFPLLFVVQALLPLAPGLLAVAGLTAVVIAAQGLHSPDGFGLGQVLGPVMGAVFAVIAAWTYRALWHDAQLHRRTVAQLQSARAELAHRERLAGELGERDRLSREIHDTLAQGLASIVLVTRAAQDSLAGGRTTAAAEQLAVIESTAVADLAEARRFVRDLSSPRLAAGLEDALSGLCRDVQQRAQSVGGPLRCELRVEGEPRPLGQDAQTALLRAAQTCMSNAEAHASAQRIVLTLAYWPEAVTLDIVDDGVGFDPHRTAPEGPDGGYGLPHLARRIESLGGTLSVESRPGDGTAVALRLPDGPGMPGSSSSIPTPVESGDPR